MILSVTEVEIIPVKPRGGLVAFASCVVNDCLYLGNIGIHTRSDGSGYRLTFPTKLLANGKEIQEVLPDPVLDLNDPEGVHVVLTKQKWEFLINHLWYPCFMRTRLSDIDLTVREPSEPIVKDQDYRIYLRDFPERKDEHRGMKVTVKVMDETKGEIQLAIPANYYGRRPK